MANADVDCYFAVLIAMIVLLLSFKLNLFGEVTPGYTESQK